MGRVKAYDIKIPDAEITLYGHTHTHEKLLEEKGIIEELLQDSDTVAVEHLGLDKHMQEGMKAEFPTDSYTGELMNMVEEAGIDTAYGPDAKNGIPYYTLGVIMPYMFIYGLAAKKGAEWAYKNREGLKQLNTEEITPVNEEISAENVTRREMMAGAATAAGAYSVGFFDSLQPREIEENIDKIKYPVAPNYNDIREVFMAEGLAKIGEKSKVNHLTGIFGRGHADSIKNYLEAPNSRQNKIDWYSQILPDYQEKMTEWTNEESYWQIEEIIDLS